MRFLLSRIAEAQYNLLQFSDVETLLLENLDIIQEVTTNNFRIYQSYDLLVNFYLRTNLKKAILMGKALLSEEEKAQIPYVLQKQFLFSLGTAYLLNGNIYDAKSLLRQCLLEEPNSELKGMALNNLAMSYWWQKIPMYDVQNQKTQETTENLIIKEEEAVINKEFGLVIPVFKKALTALENVPKREDLTNRVKLEQLFDE